MGNGSSAAGAIYIAAEEYWTRVYWYDSYAVPSQDSWVVILVHTWELPSEALAYYSVDHKLIIACRLRQG